MRRIGLAAALLITGVYNPLSPRISPVSVISPVEMLRLPRTSNKHRHVSFQTQVSNPLDHLAFERSSYLIPWTLNSAQRTCEVAVKINIPSVPLHGNVPAVFPHDAGGGARHKGSTRFEDNFATHLPVDCLCRGKKKLDLVSTSFKCTFYSWTLVDGVTIKPWLLFKPLSVPQVVLLKLVSHWCDEVYLLKQCTFHCYSTTFQGEI